MSIVFDEIQFNQDAIKWVVIFPVSIFGWILKEGSGVLFPDTNTNKILHQWPNYWRLKAHFQVGVILCFLLILPCIFMWFTNKLGGFEWAWFFFVFVIALILNASSFYFGKIELRSILIHVKEN